MASVPATAGPGLAAFASRRVTALVGPYGSGKTELAIALALDLARSRRARVVLADLDVVKPYFRSREMAAALEKGGVGLVAPRGELAMADLPIVPGELRVAIADPEVAVVVDVGGDPVGARALGSLSDVVAAAEHDLLLVLNGCRPFMDGAERVEEAARRIEDAAQLRVTGVISNTNLLEGTTLEHVLSGLALARDVAARLGVAVRLLGVPEHLTPGLGGRDDLPPVVLVRRHVVPTFLGGSVL